MKKKAFLFKKGLIWVGWITNADGATPQEKPVAYFDNEPLLTVTKTAYLEYVTISFSKSRAFKRMKNFLYKQLKEV